MKPRQLNLEEIWKLYLLLKPAIDNRETEEFLLDEIETLIERMPEGTLVRCLDILYNKLDKENLLGIQTISLFLQGLKENEFFEFVDFIKVLTNGSSK